MTQDPSKDWICDLCGEKVALPTEQSEHPQLPANCKLRDFSIGEECVAFWRQAVKLPLFIGRERPQRAALKSLSGRCRC